MLADPKRFLALLGAAVPQVSAYFVELIAVKTCFGLGVELARAINYGQARALRAAAGGVLTQRDRKKAPFLEPEFEYGRVYTTSLMVLTIGLVFSVVAPLVLPCAFAYFAFAEIVYVHNGLHVYVPRFETGGLFFFPVLRRLLSGLGGAQIALAAYLALKRAPGPSAVCAALPFLTRRAWLDLEARYGGVCDASALEACLARDARLAKPKDDAPPRPDSPFLSTIVETTTTTTPSAPPTPRSARIAATFDAYLYRQPLFSDADAAPDEPEDVEIGFGQRPVAWDAPASDISSDETDDDDASDEEEDFVAPRKCKAQVDTPLLGDNRSYGALASPAFSSPRAFSSPGESPARSPRVLAASLARSFGAIVAPDDAPAVSVARPAAAPDVDVVRPAAAPAGGPGVDLSGPGADAAAADVADDASLAYTASDDDDDDDLHAPGGSRRNTMAAVEPGGVLVASGRITDLDAPPRTRPGRRNTM